MLILDLMARKQVSVRNVVLCLSDVKLAIVQSKFYLSLESVFVLLLHLVYFCQQSFPSGSPVRSFPFLSIYFACSVIHIQN